MLSSLRQMARALVRPGPKISHPTRTAVGAGTRIHPSARLTLLDADPMPDARIVIGDDVFLGRQVEITAAGGGSVHIGSHTSLQDGDIIYGDVRVGSHCIFGRQVFAASRGHNFRRHPTWLIQDQDSDMLAALPNAGACTVIEDDCWIGQNAVVMPGTYIGRGAVIGANCVVTRDVGPYEVHGGVPNRKISIRLAFRPPQTLDAMNDDHLPYFYRGFALSRADLAQTRASQGISAHGDALLVLGSTGGGSLKLGGFVTRGQLRLRVNGVEQPVTAQGLFTTQADIPPPNDNRPVPLQGYTLVELLAEGAFSITCASIT